MRKGKFDTVIGSLSFDKKGDVSLPGYVFMSGAKVITKNCNSIV